MKDDFIPVTNQNVSGSVGNNLFKLEKEHYERQQHSRKNNVEILGLPHIFTGDHLTVKNVELCNDVGSMVKSQTLKLAIDCFKKKVTISYPKELLQGLSIDNLLRISSLNEILVQC